MTNAIHIVCPSCGAINRVAGGRSAAPAHCGACKANLFSGEPTAVDTPGFARHTAKNDIPVVVDVWAPWCGPCRTMAPHFAQAARMLEPDVRFLKVNADEQPEISARYGIRSIPTMLLFRKGALVAQTAGAMDAGRIAQWVRAHI
jgi:thioredoxin 2